MPSERNHMDPEVLKKYLSGLLDEAESKNFEDAMEEGSFEKEALEGYNTLEDKAAMLSAVKSIEKSIAKKTGLKVERKFTFPIWKTMGIAASFALLVAGVYFTSQFMKTEDNLALNDQESEMLDTPVAEEIIEESHRDIPILVDDAAEAIQYEDASEVPSEQEAEEEVASPTTVSIAKAEEKKRASDLPATKPTLAPVVDAVDVASEFTEDFALEDVEQSAAAKKESADLQSAARAESGTYKSNSYFEVGKANYDAKDYNAAINYFQDAIANNSNVTESEYYIAMSYYRNNKPNKSLKYFDAVIAKPSSSLSNNAKWYKAIILEEKGSTTEAIKLLQELANGNSAFKHQAQDKLDALN